MNNATTLCALMGLLAVTTAHAETETINTEVTAAETRPKKKGTSDDLMANSEAHTQHYYEQHSYIYDAWLRIDQDRDYDGYASSFTLSMDIDSYYASSWVYVRLTLSDDLHHYQTYHVSSDIRIEGDSNLDVFSVETQLAADYPPSDYSFAIELYDADSHQLLEVYDGYDDSDLLYIPLESREYDRKAQNSVSVEAHGGSMGLAMIAAIMGLALLRRRYDS